MNWGGRNQKYDYTEWSPQLKVPPLLVESAAFADKILYKKGGWNFQRTWHYINIMLVTYISHVTLLPESMKKTRKVIRVATGSNSQLKSTQRICMLRGMVLCINSTSPSACRSTKVSGKNSEVIFIILPRRKDLTDLMVRIMSSISISEQPMNKPLQMIGQKKADQLQMSIKIQLDSEYMKVLLKVKLSMKSTLKKLRKLRTKGLVWLVHASLTFLLSSTALNLMNVYYLPQPTPSLLMNFS